MVDRIFDDDELEEIRRLVADVQPTDLELHEARMFGRFVVHNHPAFTEVQRRTLTRISEVVCEEVEVSYNFLSLYGRVGVCPPHLDAPNAKWTLDLCVNQSAPWPIYISQVESWMRSGPGRWPEGWLGSGDQRISGLELHPVHAAPRRSGRVFGEQSMALPKCHPCKTGAEPFCDVLFFHFIPKGSGELVKPANWARIFGIPELSQAVKK